MLSNDTKKLETAYNVFNEKYFNNALPVAMITIQSSRGAYGHCTTQKVWASATELYYELNLGAEYLDRPIENVLATLVHEMVHIYCMENGIKDTSNGGRYHNTKFKQEAEKRGLKISKASYIGWSVTEPTEKFIQNIHTWGLDMACENYRLGAGNSSTSGGTSGGGAGGVDTGTDISKKPKKSSTRKYVCPCCGNSVRATKDLYIICGDCRETMIKIAGK